MSAELALAIIAAVDLCLKYGKDLKTACSTLRHAGAEIFQRVLRLDNGWIRFEHQVKYLRRIQNVMHEDHQSTTLQTLKMFGAKLEIVNSILEGLVKDHTGRGLDISRKVKYLWKKDSLDMAIDDLETWQRTADFSWFLLMKIHDASVDAELLADASDSTSCMSSARAIRNGIKAGDSSSGIALQLEALQGMSVTPFPFCDVQIGRRHHSSGNGSRAYVLENITCLIPDRFTPFQKMVRELALKLQHGDPDAFGILACKGFIIQPMGPEPEPKVTVTMVFRTPPSPWTPCSLRGLLLGKSPSSLSRRFELARLLVKAVGYVHTFDFVHKNVRPESVICFQGATFGAFLAGFNSFRQDGGWTNRKGDEEVHRNLYRHPSRQGWNLDQEFVMQHDVYSLGVCLLEIGLWTSFIEYDSTNQPSISPLLGLPLGTSTNQVTLYLQTQVTQRMLDLARNELPGLMGTKFAKIVETCLTCLEPDNADFGSEKDLEDAEGIRVGVRYIQKVLLRINMLDI